MNDTYCKDINIYNKFKEYYLTDEEDAELMAQIDIDELERVIKLSEQQIANGEGIEFREAMEQIEEEVFGAKI